MKAIVTTTINKPTEAILKFSKLKNWKLYVVGDLKTPHDQYEDGPWKYLSPEYQEANHPILSDLIGWNTIQRRNIGFLEAVKDGAKIISSVDDDNIPYENWGKKLLIGKQIEVDCYENQQGLFDPLSVTNISEYWHRGYPLEMVKNRHKNKITKINVDVKVEAGLWNGSPDIDAVSKLIYGNHQKIIQGPFPYASRKTILSSQNVFFHRSIMPYYAVLPHCGRMDDIWGCILMQHETNAEVVFTEPSTFHKRNYHNFISDMKDEIIGQERTTNFLNNKNSLPQKCLEFFERYKEEMLCFM